MRIGVAQVLVSRHQDTGETSTHETPCLEVTIPSDRHMTT